MAHDRYVRRGGQPSPATSTGRALLLAGTLVVTLLAAATGVLAALGQFDPPAGVQPDRDRVSRGSVAAPPIQLAAPSAQASTGEAPEIEATAAAQPAVPATAAGLTAFAATVADWNAHHRADPANSGSYDPDRTLGAGRTADRYVKVLPLNGRILQYTIQLPRSTTLATATARTATQLPADVRQRWQQQRPACLQVSYTSRTLGDLLGDLGDPTGAVLVEYRSAVSVGSPWDTGDVTAATLSAFDAPEPRDAPLC